VVLLPNGMSKFPYSTADSSYCSALIEGGVRESGHARRSIGTRDRAHSGNSSHTVFIVPSQNPKRHWAEATCRSRRWTNHGRARPQARIRSGIRNAAQPLDHIGEIRTTHRPWQAVGIAYEPGAGRRGRGRQLGTIFLVQGGPFLTPYFDGCDPSGSGSGIIGRDQALDLVGNPKLSNPTAIGWFNLGAYTRPGAAGWQPGTPCLIGTPGHGAPSDDSEAPEWAP